MPSAQLSLQNVGKRYNHEWIFRGVNHTFLANEHTVILGPNGSGKSTLLQTILGSTTQSEGEVVCNVAGNDIEVEDSFSHFSIAAPYLELIEEFTLFEMLEF
ncbi:MAG: ABC transporter ATP-binding protein, partial [Flavobacteriales bacterium]